MRSLYGASVNTENICILTEQMMISFLTIYSGLITCIHVFTYVYPKAEEFQYVLNVMVSSTTHHVNGLISCFVICIQVWPIRVKCELSTSSPYLIMTNIPICILFEWYSKVRVQYNRRRIVWISYWSGIKEIHSLLFLSE